MSTFTIEARLEVDPEDDASDIRADIVFSYVPGAPPILHDAYGGDPGFAPEVEIEDVLPFGCVPAITRQTLRKLAYDWLDNGGYDACCRLAEEKRGEPAE